MFYKVSLGEDSQYRVAEESNGFLYLPGDANRYSASDFETCEPLDDPVPVVRDQDKRVVKIGDNVRTICGEYEGRVTHLYHPKTIWPQGRVRIHTGHTISAAGVYVL